MKKSNIKRYLIYILLIALVILLIFFLQKNNRSKIQKIGENEYSLDLTDSISVHTKDAITSKPIPQLGAGMIPIKWDGNYWVIVDAEKDTDWYDYDNGKFATMMLSDGTYISEERYDMAGKILAKPGITITNEEDLGTIFVWIPRMVYTEEIKMYLNGTSIVETPDFMLPSCFTYKQKNQLDMAVRGIWVEQMPLDTEEAVTEEKIVMNTEENDYGLIRNEIVENIDSVTNKVAKRLENGTNLNKQQIIEIDNTNRAMIRIINTNVNTPIITHGYAEGNTIHINVVYSDNQIEKIISIDKDEVISEYSNNTTMETTENGMYTFAIVDTMGNVKIIKVQVGEGIPDLTGFRLNTTYAVLYDENENEYSNIPISEILKIKEPDKDISENNALIKGEIDFKKLAQIENNLGATWFDYKDRKWANIVVRNNGGESYYSWLPRYVYWLDEETQFSHVTIVNTDNEDKYGTNMLEDEDGWILPDAFTWVDNNGETQPLSGYWIGKYAITDTTDLDLKVDNEDNIIGGASKLIINNISCNLSNVTYKIYVYDHNKKQVDEYFAEGTQPDPDYQLQDGSYYCDNRDYVRFNTILPADNKSIIFAGLDGSTYDVRIAVYDEFGHYRAEKWWKDIEVIDKVDNGRTDVNDVIEPGLIESIKGDEYTTFNPETTYYVSYDSNNAEILTPITSNPPTNWYDYENSKWANIVVIKDKDTSSEKRAYFVWLPRYIYKLDEVRQSTEVKVIRVGDTIPAGWTLPDAFSWVDNNGVTKQLEGYWIGKYAISDS